MGGKYIRSKITGVIFKFYHNVLSSSARQTIYHPRARLNAPPVLRNPDILRLRCWPCGSLFVTILLYVSHRIMPSCVYLSELRCKKLGYCGILSFLLYTVNPMFFDTEFTVLNPFLDTVHPTWKGGVSGCLVGSIFPGEGGGFMPGDAWVLFTSHTSLACSITQALRASSTDIRIQM